jgi:hypothetical protein
VTDVWEGLGKTHVIIALTPEECAAIVHLAWATAHQEDAHVHTAVKDIMLSLRDQKGVEL